MLDDSSSQGGRAMRMLWYGTEEPAVPSRTLRAGQLSVELHDGNLRALSFGQHEIVRGIAFLVRDENWGTLPAAVDGLVITEDARGFRVDYRACIRKEAATLNCTACITATGDRLRFSARVVPDTDFVTNRTGFVVLHPIAGVAGCEVKVEHVDGSVRTTYLPKNISPHQPLLNLRALTHFPAPGLSVTVRFEGDVFEMEDQRNWTDASFKTYVRPLALPFPYVLASGVPIEQAIEVSVGGAALQAGRPEHAFVLSETFSGTQPVRLRVGEVVIPGQMPSIGLGLFSNDDAPTQDELDRLSAIGLSALVARCDLTRGQGAAELRRAGDLAQAISARLFVEAILPCRNSATVQDELHMLARALEAATLYPEGIAVSPAADLKTGSPHDGVLPSLDVLYRAARAILPGVKLGGGTFAYFTELNRKRPPVEYLDYVTHTTCPIVHAADDDSVMQTIEALPSVFESTRAFIGDRDYHVGPISLAMRENPYGAAPTPNPYGRRLAMAEFDPRQYGLFGAAFYLGYAACAARAGVAQLSLCAPSGRRGLFKDGAPVPAFFAIHMLAQAAGAKLIAVDTPPGIAALGLVPPGSHAERTMCSELLIANLRPRPTLVELVSSEGKSVKIGSGQRLDEAAQGGVPCPLDLEAQGVVRLGGYGIARLLFVP